MTLTEQYNEYVKECIKERPAFSGPYEDYYLEFDEWIDDFTIKFAIWTQTHGYELYSNGWKIFGEKVKSSEQLLEIFKKERGL